MASATWWRSCDVVLHLGAAQVEVAIFQAQLFVGGDVLRRKERRQLAVVEQPQFGGDDFDLAGRDVLVDVRAIAQLDRADDGDDELVAKLAGFVVHARACVRVEDDLRDAGAVAKIDEDEVAEIAAAVDPAHENDAAAGIGGAKFAACDAYV